MTETLLQTKLFIPPPRSRLVPRPRLLQKLDAGREGRLSLIAAPAGSGKTTLVTHWLQSQPAAAWLALDENDNAALRFFTYLLAAVQTAAPAVGQSLATVLEAGRLTDELAVIRALINDFAGQSEPIVLVLDDYHVINNERLHQAIAFLVDYAPPSLHLIITSRVDPPLPLPRWRARGQLTEIRADELRFDDEEASAFLLGTMDLMVANDTITDLLTQTEGWIAGLQLAALSLRRVPDPAAFARGFAGSHRQIAEYLLQEVLLLQPLEHQAFLLQTAVFERFNADLADYVLEKSDSRQVLQALVQANLFLIPLDHEHYWYRYHHLFAEMLTGRLRRDRPVAEQNRLFQRAGEWFESQGLLEEAVEQALHIADYDEAARRIASLDLGMMFVRPGGNALLQKWVAQLPFDSIKKHPRMAVLAVGSYMITGNIQGALQHLPIMSAEPALRGYHDLFMSIIVRNESGDFQRALELAKQAQAGLAGEGQAESAMAHLQVVVNHLNLGDLAAAEVECQRLHRRLRDDTPLGVGMTLQVVEMEGIIARNRAELDQAEQLYREALQLATRLGNEAPHQIGLMHAGLAHVYLARNELDQAEAELAETTRWAEKTGITDIVTHSIFLSADLACIHRDKERLGKSLAAVNNLIYRSEMEEIIKTADVLSAYYHWRIGDLQEAVAWADQSDLSLDDEPIFKRFDGYLVLAGIRLSQYRRNGRRDDLPRLAAMADQLIAFLADRQHIPGKVDTFLLKALVLDYQGDRPAAQALLGQALELAAPGRLRRVFLNWGAPLADLLPGVPTTQTQFVRELQAAFAAELPEAPAAVPLDLLTAREMDVLQAIAAGRSNKEIEETLFISNNTVRTHIKNLYSKLGVSGRVQAISRARELGLIA